MHWQPDSLDFGYKIFKILSTTIFGAVSLSFLVRVFALGAMDRRIDPSWGGPIELFLIPASATRLV